MTTDDTTTPTLTDAVTEVLRSYWPEAGGQASFAAQRRQIAACAEALVAAERARTTEVKAEALREAAREIEAGPDYFQRRSWVGRWLRDRAERLGSAEPAPKEGKS